MNPNLIAPLVGSRKYPRGTYTDIARRLGITPQAVRNVAMGSIKSARIERELRRVARNVARRVRPLPTSQQQVG